jgi:hypothetical protein
MKEELRRFRADGPGRRFLNHHERARAHRTWWKVAVRVGTGTLSIIWGIALWVLPGPGWLFVIFGLALLAGVSRRISRFMDAAEVRVRGLLGKAKRSWRRSSVAVKAAIIVATVAAAGGLVFWAWRIWVGW